MKYQSRTDKYSVFSFTCFSKTVILTSSYYVIAFYDKTRKYMHAETPRLADKTIVFSEHEVVMVTQQHDTTCNCHGNTIIS